MRIQLKIDQSKFKNYILMGKSAQKRIREVMRDVANIGRKEVRSKISNSFRRRTGRLNREARNIRTTINARPALVSAKVGPMPRLLNIFEHGATIPAREILTKKAKTFKLHGGGWDGIFVRGPIKIGAVTLSPRPVMKPALTQMERVATKDIVQILGTMEQSA